MAMKAYMAIRRTAGFFAVALFVAGPAISFRNAQEISDPAKAIQLMGVSWYA
jgi:hypothetical protein